MKRLDIRGQQSIGMSFGMIFAIFLIVVFVVIAFVAINHFLDIGKTSEVGQFYNDLQSAVDNAWNGQSSESNFKIKLPSGIDYVCFANLTKNQRGPFDSEYDELEIYDISEKNVFIVPPTGANGLEKYLVKHIDLERIISDKNPNCFEPGNNLRISKGFYDKLVMIE